MAAAGIDVLRFFRFDFFAGVVETVDGKPCELLETVKDDIVPLLPDLELLVRNDVLEDFWIVQETGPHEIAEGVVVVFHPLHGPVDGAAKLVKEFLVECFSAAPGRIDLHHQAEIGGVDDVIAVVHAFHEWIVSHTLRTDEVVQRPFVIDMVFIAEVFELFDDRFSIRWIVGRLTPAFLPSSAAVQRSIARAARI